jgi:hypothetical protein
MILALLKRAAVGASAALVAALTMAAPTAADHSWGNYHWARTSNPFTVRLGDNVSSAWDPYLQTASSDWSASSVLDTPVVAGSGGNCNIGFRGTVQVCNRRYGNTGWLGVAQIAVDGDHITAGVVKLNDTYFLTAKYNTPAWRRLVMCQEIGHTLGLDHTDEVFDNPNQGTCMDYTSNPSGPPSNEHPNQHDYDQLVTIYTHLDRSSTVSTATAQASGVALPDAVSDFGRAIRADGRGRPHLFVRDLGGSQRLFTFVFWAD